VISNNEKEKLFTMTTLLVAIFGLLLSCINCDFTWIERSYEGDSFDVSCSTCHLYDSTCIQQDGWFGCCTQCQCQKKYTIFDGMCHGDTSHEEIGCKLYTKGNQYYGLDTTTFYTSLTDLGWIMKEESWNPREFTTCYVLDDSYYWNTKGWISLFTNGRKKEDFYLENGSSGVFLKFLGSPANQHLYKGLLIKLQMTCSSFYSETVTSCLVIKVAGKRYYYGKDKPTTSPPKTLTTIKPLETTKQISTTQQKRSSNSTKPSKTTPIHSSHTSHAPHIHTDDENKVFLKKFVPFIAVASFLLLFCLIFICCRVKRNNKDVQPKTYLLAADKASYSSSDASMELVTSAEFEVISTPSYCDVEELKLANFAKKRSRAPSGIYYVNQLNDSRQSTLGSQSSESPMNTGSKIYLIDGDAV